MPAPQPSCRSSSSGRRERQEHDRQGPDPRRERQDQVEQVVVGPVDVLEDEDRGLVAGDRLEELADRVEERLAVGRLGSRVDADEHAQMPADGVGVGSRPVEQRGCRRAAASRRPWPPGRSRTRRRASSPAWPAPRRCRSRDTGASGPARPGRRRPPAIRPNSAARVDLPTPAGPKIETRCGSRFGRCALPERVQDRDLERAADDRRGSRSGAAPPP